MSVLNAVFPAEQFPIESRGLSFRRLHRLVFVVLAIAAVLPSAAGAPLSLIDMPVLAGLAILLLGVPHGAFDVAIARRRFGLHGTGAVSRFLCAYVGLAASVVIVWLMLPELALPVFIALSGYHFSKDWSGELDGLPRVIVGWAMIGSPALIHRDAVSGIFAWIVPGEIAAMTADIMAAAAIPLLQAAALIVGVTACRNLSAAIEIAATLLLAVFATPLVFIVVYFCGLHSLRHLEEAYAELQPASPTAFMRMAMPYAPLAIIGVSVSALLVPSLDPGDAFLAVIFIALAALTVPHMLLVEERMGTGQS